MLLYLTFFISMLTFIFVLNQHQIIKKLSDKIDALSDNTDVRDQDMKDRS